MKIVLEASCCLMHHSPLELDDCRMGYWRWGRWERMTVYMGWQTSEGWSANSHPGQSQGWWHRPGPTRGRRLGGSGWGQLVSAGGWLPPPCHVLSGPLPQDPANSLWMDQKRRIQIQTILIPVPGNLKKESFISSLNFLHSGFISMGDIL